MANLFTVDASVFLNAFNPYEAGHAESRQFLERLQQQAIPIIVPAIVLPEIAAAISRGCGNAELARQFTGSLERLPHLVLVPVDLASARQAADVAAGHHVRGSDAMYIAVALRFGSALATLDREQHERASGALKVFYPAEALAELA